MAPSLHRVRKLGTLSRLRRDGTPRVTETGLDGEASAIGNPAGPLCFGESGLAQPARDGRTHPRAHRNDSVTILFAYHLAVAPRHSDQVAPVRRQRHRDFLARDTQAPSDLIQQTVKSDAAQSRDPDSS